MTDREQGELDDIRASVGVRAVNQDNIEDALFGGGPTEVVEVDVAAFDTEIVRATGQQKEDWTTAEMRNGLALNAAIVLHNPKGIDKAQADVEALVKDREWNLQVIDWQQASGMTGQYITVMRVVLWVALAIIFGVAMIIVNNAMVTNTLDRTAEIGTMRAIGAQRSLVLSLIVAETTALGLIAGTAGAFTGALFIAYLGQVGIPAFDETIVMLFGGPRLFPALSAGDMVLGLGIVCVVAVFSAIYPAVVAARVQPIVAMRGSQ
jgi:ABC-type antimicrobial peptide transport system permease subunit